MARLPARSHQRDLERLRQSERRRAALAIRARREEEMRGESRHGGLLGLHGPGHHRRNGQASQEESAAGAGEEVRGSPRSARGRPPPPPPAARRESPTTHDLLAMQAGLRAEDTPTALTLAGTELSCWRGRGGSPGEAEGCRRGSRASTARLMRGSGRGGEGPPGGWGAQGRRGYPGRGCQQA